MRYLLSRVKQDRAERIYRIYVADSLYYSGQGKTLTQRYTDLLKPKKKDNRTAEQIANDVIKSIGLKMV